MSGNILLNRKQAAEKLGIAEQTIADLRLRGLPCVRVGRIFKYPEDQLDAYLKAQSQNWIDPTPESQPPPRVDPDSPLELIAFASLYELRIQRRLLTKLVGRLP